MSRVKPIPVKVISGQLRSNIKPLGVCQILEKVKVSSKENYGVFSFFKIILFVHVFSRSAFNQNL